MLVAKAWLLFGTDEGVGHDVGREVDGVSAPTVHDGTVYITGNIDDRTVYAVDATDGTEQWQFAPDHELDTPAAAAGDLVFSSTTGASSTGSTLTQGLYPAAR